MSPVPTDQLASKRGQLIVSLPRNDLDLARAAVDAGADAVKVHINIRHVSGHDFGTLADNRETFEKILGLGAPVGMVPGAHDTMATPDELRQAAEMGFAFINADITASPPYLTDLAERYVPSIGGAPGELTGPWLAHLRDYPGDWLEASSVSREGHRQPLRLTDLLGLRHTAALTGRRMIVPSVRQLTPADMRHLFDISHVWAVMIGAYVTGSTTGELSAATTAFRSAIDDAL